MLDNHTRYFFTIRKVVQNSCKENKMDLLWKNADTYEIRFSL